MYLKSGNIEIIVNDKADEVIEELFIFQLHFSRYQIGWEISMKVSEFFFDCIQLLYYKCHNIKPNHGGSNIDSLDFIKSKKEQ